MQNKGSETAATNEAMYEIPFTEHLRQSFDYGRRKKDVSSRHVQLEMLDACISDEDRLELLDYLIGHLPSVLDVVAEIRCPKGASPWLTGATKWLSLRTHVRQVREHRERQEMTRRFKEITKRQLVFSAS